MSLKIVKTKVTKSRTLGDLLEGEVFLFKDGPDQSPCMRTDDYERPAVSLKDGVLIVDVSEDEEVLVLNAKLMIEVPV